MNSESEKELPATTAIILILEAIMKRVTSHAPKKYK